MRNPAEGARVARRGGAAAVLLALVALWIAGCAVPPAGVQPQSPAPQRTGVTEEGGGGADVPVPSATPVGAGQTQTQTQSTRPAPAVVDSGPSREAIEVLESIREPLRPEERTAAPAAAGGQVPIPSPTLPLGDQPGPDPVDPFAAADSAAADTSGAAAPPPAGGTPATPPAGGAPAAPDAGTPAAPPAHEGPCWRVQLGAPETREEATQVQSAAVSLLLIQAVIEEEGGLFKVRTSQCLDRDGAARLRERALGSGFEGAFLVKTESQ